MSHVYKEFPEKLLCLWTLSLARQLDNVCSYILTMFVVYNHNSQLFGAYYISTLHRLNNLILKIALINK